MKTELSAQIEYLHKNFSVLAQTCQPLWHPLGFVSCEVRKKGGYMVRLHYWPKCERRGKNPNWPIHTHVYNLVSRVLGGRVRNIQYRETKGEEFKVYLVEYFGDQSAIGLTDERTSIEKVKDEIIDAGKEYSVEVGTFHETVVDFGEAAWTLVVLSDVVAIEPKVLGVSGGRCYRYDRVEFDKLLFWTEMKNVLQSVERW